MRGGPPHPVARPHGKGEVMGCCETCKHWSSDEERGIEGGKYDGVCQWILAVRDKMATPEWLCWGFTRHDYGTRCAAWEQLKEKRPRPQFKPGWLKKQMAQVRKEVDSWPD